MQGQGGEHAHDGQHSRSFRREQVRDFLAVVLHYRLVDVVELRVFQRHAEGRCKNGHRDGKLEGYQVQEVERHQAQKKVIRIKNAIFNSCRFLLRRVHVAFKIVHLKPFKGSFYIHDC